MDQYTRLIDDARGELRERIKYELDNGGELKNVLDDVGDIISEIADTKTPLNCEDILAFAQDNVNLFIDEPELGPAVDGRLTASNIVAANIYEAIDRELYEYVDANRDEWIDNNSVE